MLASEPLDFHLNLNSELTCVDILAPSNLQSKVSDAGAAAGSSETLKWHKFQNLTGIHISEPFGAEPPKQPAKKLIDASHDQNAGLFLAQRIR